MPFFPTDLFPGYETLSMGDAAPAEGLFIPRAALSGLSLEEAQPGSGDARKIAYEMCKAIFTNVSTAPQADRPSRLTVSRSTPSGAGPTTINQTYSFTFTLDITGVDVAPEP